MLGRTKFLFSELTDRAAALLVRQRYKATRPDLTKPHTKTLVLEAERLQNILILHDEDKLRGEVGKYVEKLVTEGYDVGLLTRNAVAACYAEVGDLQGGLDVLKGWPKDSVSYTSLIRAAGKVEDGYSTAISLWEEAQGNGVRVLSHMYGAMLIALHGWGRGSDFQKVFDAFLESTSRPTESHFAMYISFQPTVSHAVAKVLPMMSRHQVTVTNTTVSALFKLLKAKGPITDAPLIFNLNEVSSGVAVIGEKEYTILLTAHRASGNLQQLAETYVLLKKSVRFVRSNHPHVVYLKALTDHAVPRTDPTHIPPEELFSAAISTPGIPTHHPWTALFKYYAVRKEREKAVELLERLKKTKLKTPFPLREAIELNGLRYGKKKIQTWRVHVVDK